MTENTLTDKDFRGAYGTDLTIEDAWNIGKAVADWLSTTGDVAVISNDDTRDLTHAIIEGARLQGRTVLMATAESVGDVADLINARGLSGAVTVTNDSATEQVIIEIYQQDSKRVEKANGLGEIVDLIEGGNFVPAAIKGQAVILI